MTDKHKVMDDIKIVKYCKLKNNIDNDVALPISDVPPRPRGLN